MQSIGISRYFADCIRCMGVLVLCSRSEFRLREFDIRIPDPLMFDHEAGLVGSMIIRLSRHYPRRSKFVVLPARLPSVSNFHKPKWHYLSWHYQS